jgi:23S rRNA pseudouridine2605 synthase
VEVDGDPARIGQIVDPDAATVSIDGIRLPIRPDLVYYLLYKPPGVVSTAADPGGRPIVTDLVPEAPRVFPVGRLDVESEGLLMMTNDGDLTNLVTHPRYGVEKTYVARVEGSPRRSELVRLTEGIDLDDGPAAAVRARVLDRSGGESLVEIVMAEGRKREVRRMLAAIGHPVTRLVRTAIGPITDRKLRAGKWRALSIDEVRSLYSAAGEAWFFNDTATTETE